MSLRVTKIEVENKKRTQRLTSHLGSSLTEEQVLDKRYRFESYLLNLTAFAPNSVYKCNGVSSRETTVTNKTRGCCSGPPPDTRSLGNIMRGLGLSYP